MATLWIREYAAIGAANVPSQSGGAGIPVAQEPGIDQTPLTFTASAQSAAFGLSTRYIAIYGSAAFHYVVAANPNATTNALKVPADTPLFIGVSPGDKIAAILAV